jgi:hypothetical protein
VLLLALQAQAITLTRRRGEQALMLLLPLTPIKCFLPLLALQAQAYHVVREAGEQALLLSRMLSLLLLHGCRCLTCHLLLLPLLALQAQADHVDKEAGEQALMLSRALTARCCCCLTCNLLLLLLLLLLAFCRPRLITLTRKRGSRR